MKYCLLLLCVAEMLLISYCQNIAGIYLSPLLLFIVSLSISILFLKITGNAADSIVPVKQWPGAKYITGALFILFSITIVHILSKGFSEIKVSLNDVSGSDIIPQIMYLVKRFHGGEQPYYTIQFPGYSLFPTYQPLQWIPYLAAELTNSDYRWIPVIFLLLISLLFFIRNSFLDSLDGNIILKIIVPLWPLLIWLLLIENDAYMFTVTVETLMAAYYLFLSMAAAKSRNAIWLGIGIAICLLSRYSIIFWVPLCLGCYYIAGKRKDVLVIISVLFIAFIGVYWLPFLRKDPTIFLKGYQYHSNAAFFEWCKNNHITGLGFTSSVMSLIHGDDLQRKLFIYQKIHLAFCSLTVIALFFYYRKNKSRYELSDFLLFSMKVYLAVFYAFIQIPYKYLFIVPIIISSSLLAGAFKKTSVHY